MEIERTEENGGREKERGRQRNWDSKNSDMKDDTVEERQEADNTNHISVFIYYPAV